MCVWAMHSLSWGYALIASICRWETDRSSVYYTDTIDDVCNDVKEAAATASDGVARRMTWYSSPRPLSPFHPP